MKTRFYMVRNDAADSWQLCGQAGMPCMARGSLGQALARAKHLESVRANKLEWPIPVFHAVDDATPAQWNGKITSGGEWIDRSGGLPPVRDCDRAHCESALEALNLARAAGGLVRVWLFTPECDGARVAVGPDGEWIVETDPTDE